MARMLGNELYYHQTDDDDPLTTVRGMRSRQKQAWKREATESINEYYQGEDDE